MPRLKMRRNERQTSETEALQMIAEANVGRLATISENGYPYVVAMNHALFENRIVMHSAHKGHKIDNITRDPRVCFEVSRMLGVNPGDIPCTTTAQFESAIAFGKASIINDTEEKRAALSALALKYANVGGPFEDSHLNSVCVISIEIEGVTGKALR